MPNKNWRKKDVPHSSLPCYSQTPVLLGLMLCELSFPEKIRLLFCDLLVPVKIRLTLQDLSVLETRSSEVMFIPGLVYCWSKFISWSIEHSNLK